MTSAEIMQQLKKLGTSQTRKTFARHGCLKDFFGVKIGDMKPIAKKIGTNTKLAKQLYKTGNADAQYFAGLIADGSEFSTAELEQWVKGASWRMVSEYTVAWVTAEHAEGWDVALGWIDSPNESIATAGWNALSSIVSTRPDDELDFPRIKQLLKRVVKDIKKAPNRVRYTMNCFVIAVGSFVTPLAKGAVAAAKAIGKVEVDVGDTACKVPLAEEYIQHVIASGRQGKKRKSVKC